MTLSKERLEEIESVLSAGALGYSIDREEVLAMARELLALRERAEPVAYMWMSDRKDVDLAGYYRPEHKIFAESSVKQYGGEVVALYATPPAPVAKIPGFRSKDMNDGYSPDAFAWNSGISECAEMLKEQGYQVEHVEGTLGVLTEQSAPVVPDAYEIIAEAWRLMDGMNPETSDWHTAASLYLNACYAAMLKPAQSVAVPDFKKLSRALVENLVDCDAADDSAMKQYLEWTEKTLRAAIAAPGKEG